MLGNISLFTVFQCYFKHFTDINTSLIYLPAWPSRDTGVDDSWFQLCAASRAISLSLSPGSGPCSSGCPGPLGGSSHPASDSGTSSLLPRTSAFSADPGWSLPVGPGNWPRPSVSAE